MKFSITDFFIKRDENNRKLRIWYHLLKKSVMKNFILCIVYPDIVNLLTKFYVSPHVCNF